MPYSHELNEKKTKSKETEKDVDEVSQWVSQDDVGASSSDEGSDNDRFFSFIREMHLEEAREFRRKGYNSQVPEVDPELVTQLRNEVAKARTIISVAHTHTEGPLGTAWLRKQLRQIESFTDTLSDDRMRAWVGHVLSGKSREGSGWNKSNAQSLVRRLESTLQTLIRIVRTLRAIDDYSTPEKRCEMLVTEFMDAFSSSEENTVIQVLENMTADAAGSADWYSLMQARAAAWENGTFGAMRETTKQEAKKAREKENAEALSAESQRFFGDIARYLEILSGNFKEALVKLNQSASPRTIPEAKGDKVTVPSSQPTPFLQKVKHAGSDFLQKVKHAGSDFLQKVKHAGSDFLQKVKHAGSEEMSTAGVFAAEVEKIWSWGTGYLSGDYTLKDRIQARRKSDQHVETTVKKREQVIADSIIRSILWQWQQPAIKIEYASGALLSKIKELKKIKAMFSPDASEYDSGNEPEGSDIPVSQPDEDDLVAQARKWVHDGIEQENPENQRSAKLAALNQLLAGDIGNARRLVARLGNSKESIQNMLKRQRFTVLKMLPALAPSLKAVDTLLPDIASDLTASVAALDNALLAAENPGRNFSEAGRLAKDALLLATKVNKNISAESAKLTGLILDDHSRGARLARHWATLARERNPDNGLPLDAKQVLSSLKKYGWSEGVLSYGDPKGYLFATRLAGEFENARNDELRLPMSPEQYTALEKGLVEYIVKWGQKRVSSGGTRFVFELSFDAATFSFKPVLLAFKLVKVSIKIPYKINKVNKHIMPGQDKPYKAIYGMLGKKLKQLGFSLMMSPVPGVVKSGAGAVLTTAAGAYNKYIEGRENTFSAIYERVAEGKKSEQIKMTSPVGMLVDSLTYAPLRAGVNVAKWAMKPGMRGFSGIPGNILREQEIYLSEHHTSRESEGGVVLDKEQEAKEYPDEINEETLLQAQSGKMAAETYTSALVNAAVKEGEANPASHSSTLQQQIDVKPFSDNSDQNADQPRVRRKRETTDETLQSELFDFNHNVHYKDFSDDKKKITYLYGTKFVLLQIENDENIPDKIRKKAYLARIGAEIAVPVDIKGYKLNNTFLIPDNPGSKSGVLVHLDSEVPYYYVSKGENLLENIKWAMPYNANQRRYYIPTNNSVMLNGMDELENIRTGKYSFDKYFNYSDPKSMDITSLSSLLANTIEDDYKHRKISPTNKILIHRAILGSKIPDQEVSVTQAKYHLEFTWANLTPAEFLRSFERPFSTLSGQIQLIVSDMKGETIQETERNVLKAKYIGNWIDVSVGAVTSLTPEGLVLNTAQSIAGIAADLAEGKDPNLLAIAALFVGSIPGGRIAAKVGQFSSIGGKSIKYGLMLGNKGIDLAIVGKSIKTAVDSGEPLAIYQAVLASGMSVKNSYDMAKNMSSKLKISKKMEDSAQLEKLEALQNNAPEYSVSSKMPVRTFRIGQTELLGKISEGGIEISRDNGTTWEKGSKLHLLAYRLQNAGGGRKLPEEGESASQDHSQSTNPVTENPAVGMPPPPPPPPPMKMGTTPVKPGTSSAPGDVTPHAMRIGPVKPNWTHNDSEPLTERQETLALSENGAKQKPADLPREADRYYDRLVDYYKKNVYWEDAVKKGQQKYTEFYEALPCPVSKPDEYRLRYEEKIESKDSTTPYIDKNGVVAEPVGKVIDINVKGEQESYYKFRVSNDGKVFVVDNMYKNRDVQVTREGIGEPLHMNELQGEFMKKNSMLLKNVEFITQENIASNDTHTIMKHAFGDPALFMSDEKPIVLRREGTTKDAFDAMLATPNVQPTARMLSTYPQFSKRIVEIRIQSVTRITLVLEPISQSATTTNP